MEIYKFSNFDTMPISFNIEKGGFYIKATLYYLDVTDSLYMTLDFDDVRRVQNRRIVPYFPVEVEGIKFQLVHQTGAYKDFEYAKKDEFGLTIV